MRLVVVNHVTLDGVMQSPSDPEEDARNDFAHGGWAPPYTDEVMGRVMGEGMAQGGALLFGRRTYEQFASYWPHQTDNPFTPVLNAREKYVASRTLTDPLPWENSTLLGGDVAAAVDALRREPGKDLVVLGSGQLVQTLMRHDLVDQYVLTVHPLVLGSGRRLFDGGARRSELRLLDAVPTTTGVLIATYEPVRQEATR